MSAPSLPTRTTPPGSASISRSFSSLLALSSALSRLSCSCWFTHAAPTIAVRTSTPTFIQRRMRISGHGAARPAVAGRRMEVTPMTETNRQVRLRARPGAR